MSESIILAKIIVLGSPGVGKTSFLRYHGKQMNWLPDYSETIGVDFNVWKTKLDDQYTLKFQIWDVKPSYRWSSMLPMYCRDAMGCLLFFDVSNRESFDDLHYWMHLIQDNAGDIPVILIGTKTDLPFEVSYEGILDFMRIYNLESYYLVSIRTGFNEDDIFYDLARRIFQTPEDSLEFSLLYNLYFSIRRSYSERKVRLFMLLTNSGISDDGRNFFLDFAYERFFRVPSFLIEHETFIDYINRFPHHSNESSRELQRRLEMNLRAFLEKDALYLKLSPDEKKQFDRFAEFFSVCPICKRKNHLRYLRNFYFDEDPEKVRLKKRLLEIMDEFPEFEKEFINTISIGIPCCLCFNEIFDLNKHNN